MSESVNATTVEEAIDLIREATDDVIEGVTWIKPGKRWLCRLHTGWVGLDENGSFYLPILKWKDTRTVIIRDDLCEISYDSNRRNTNLLALASIEEFRRELEQIDGSQRRFVHEEETDPLLRRLQYVVEFPAFAVNEPGTLDIIVTALQNLSARTAQQA